MPGVIVQALAALKPARDHRHKGFDRLEPIGDRRRLAEQLRIDADQQFRILIGRAAEHDSVDMAEMRARRVEVREAAVEDDRPVGMGALQIMDESHSRAAGSIGCPWGSGPRASALRA